MRQEYREILLSPSLRIYAQVYYDASRRTWHAILKGDGIPNYDIEAPTFAEVVQIAQNWIDVFCMP